MSYANTALLLPGIGADASTVFNDFSRYDRTGTIRGGIEIDTAQSRFYGSSLYMPATTAVGTSQPGLVYTGVSLGAGLWTVRGWMRTADNTKYTFLFDTRDSGTTDINDCAVWFDAASQRAGFVHNPAGSTVVTSGTTPIVNNTWYHVEVTHDAANDARLFLGGNLEATVNTTRNLNSGWLFVGNWNTASSNSTPDHWINDFQFLPGVCLHTASFTPPAKLIGMLSNTGTAGEPVNDDTGTAAVRTIIAVPRIYGSTFHNGYQTESDGSGNFSLSVPNSAEFSDIDGYSVIALDDAAGTVHNDKIHRPVSTA